LWTGQENKGCVFLTSVYTAQYDLQTIEVTNDRWATDGCFRKISHLKMQRADDDIARRTPTSDHPRVPPSLSSAQSRYVDNSRCHTYLVNGTRATTSKFLNRAVTLGLLEWRHSNVTHRRFSFNLFCRLALPWKWHFTSENVFVLATTLLVSKK